MRRLILILFAIFFISKVFMPSIEGGHTDEKQASTQEVKYVASQHPEPKPAIKETKKWRYQTHTDTLSGKDYKVATLRSDNSMSLRFPYQGINYGHLVVRQHPQYGFDVYFKIDKGQILCRSYSGCVHRIRFDEGEVENFTASGPADNSSTAIFSRYPKWALEKLKTANKIIVRVTMHNEGDQTLVFTVDDPLKWE